MRLTAAVRGLDLTIKSIEGLSPAAAGGAFAGITKGLFLADLAARKLISASDHSLADLAKAGHPYAVRDPHPPHSDPVIHAQTGRYLDALKLTPPVGKNFAGSPAIIKGRLGIEGDEEMEQLDRWLQEGTLKMIARPWMEQVIKTQGAAIADVISTEIWKAVRARYSSRSLVS